MFLQNPLLLEMIVILLIATVQLSMSAVPMMREQDPLLIAIDDIEGLLYELPEYEDPQMIEHQLSSFGAMPVFTLLDMAKKHGDFKEEEFSQKAKIAESKKAVDDIINRLQATRAKLEKGNINIYTDIEKSIQDLKKLERSFRPDVRQVLSSLRASMSIAKPLVLQATNDLLGAKRPSSYEKLSIFEMPEKYDKQAINVKVISGGKSVLDKNSFPTKFQRDIKENGDEKSADGEKPAEEKLKNEESTEKTKERSEVTKGPFKLQPYKSRNIDDEDTPTLYLQNWGWRT